MIRAIARLLAPLSLLATSTTAAAAERPRPRWHVGTASDPHDVAFVPVGLAVGAAVLSDRRSVHSGASVGLDMFSGTWSRLAWTGAQLRVQLYSHCAGVAERECGLTADFFVGSGAGLAFALDSRRLHMMTTTVGLGWGMVGHDTGGPARSGVVASPAIRYSFIGLVGVEVQAFLPGYALGDRYPAGITFNLVLSPTSAH